MRITFTEAQRNVTEIANRESYNLDVIFELLAAYGRSASSITKLRNGALNLAGDKDNNVLQRGVVYFKHIHEGNLLSTVDSLDQDPLVVRYNPRYLIATDYDRLVAKDTKKDTTLDVNLRDIDRNVDFFYGWTGDELTSEKTEAVADRRAADKMKDLYTEIEKVNRVKLTDPKSTFKHDLNVFFSRLLFCFFAEDTKVFSKDERAIFTNSIKDFTQTDGSDLDAFLNTLFDALDANDKSNFTSPYSKFPYVNGTIFDTKKHNIAIPKFNAQARKLMIDCGSLDWSAINPDIFGSMFQSIVDEEHRANHGMHYTSVPNIMKTIEPLFLDELREEFDKYYDNNRKLNQLWDRISKIKIFDPACGSGNFLIIAYKELRKIEHGIIDRLFHDDYKRAMLSGKLESRIKLDNFYGIEIDDFAHEIAILSLYLAKHQMNIEFEEHFGKEIILIPLADNAKIVQGNAARLDWQNVCPNVEHVIDGSQPDQQYLLDIEVENDQGSLISDGELKQKHWDEIYLIGNPPYGGFLMQDHEQKKDMALVFTGNGNYKKLDYIACWFIKARQYISDSKARAAFVTTNSISQGEQVALLWPSILKNDIEIGFAYTSFKWMNSAKGNAGVTCVIISLRKVSNKKKYIFDGLLRSEVPHINGYLAGSDDVFIENRSKSISGLPKISLGSSPYENGNLLLSPQEKEKLISEHPEASQFIKRFVGSAEFVRSIEKYCIWIEKTDLDKAMQIPLIALRIEAVRDFRLKSKRRKTIETAATPYEFTENRHNNARSIIIPIVTSERREYLPVGYLDSDSVIPNSARAIYDPEPYIFSILASRMHTTWLRAIGGKLKTDFRYSALVYNTFPIRALLNHEKQELTRLARDVLFARENHSEQTFAALYEPDKMPTDLREAHNNLDLAIDRLYRPKPYNNDEERLADLFDLYEQMTEREKSK